MLAAYRVADLNPLGSGAGYGSSFPIDRRLTTDLLGFEDMHYNVVNAQMSRGRTERLTSFGLSSLAGTLSRLAGDVCLYASQNFGLIKLPDEFTTGSSIMPHKKNPDVFELIRAKCNKIQALPGEIEHIYINLPSGYFRDMQIIKESFFPVFAEMKSCLSMAAYALEKVIPVENTLQDERYKYIFSVEEVNRLVMQGTPFREAYKEIAAQIADGSYRSDHSVMHTHEGSIGNLCNDRIALKIEKVIEQFHFERKDKSAGKIAKEWCMKKQTIIVRIEISTLMGGEGKINRRKMDRLAMVLTNLHNSGKHVMVVSSGAIVLGTEKLKLQTIPENQLEMQAAASVGQAELIRWYQHSFDEYNQIIAQVLLTSDIMHYPQRVENTRNTFNRLLDMSIIPIINENDSVSTADIEFDDNYPLALMVAEIAKADFIIIKMEMDDKYLIVPRGKRPALLVDGETELQEKLESFCQVMVPDDKMEKDQFPASIGEIVF